MKRFVSALIAGAMILSMSVASFADVTFGVSNTKTERPEVSVKDISLNFVRIFRDGVEIDAGEEGSKVENAEVIAGDTLYFAMNKIGTKENIGGKADKDWRIKVSKASNIDSVDFFWNEKDMADGGIGNADTLWVKVKVSEDFNSYEKDAMKVWFYLYDVSTKEESERVKVGFKYADYEEEILYKNDLDHIVPLKLNTIYTLDKDVNSANVVFSYDDMYIVTKLYAGEKYLVNSITTKYDKDMAINYDADVEVISIVSNKDNYDVFFESSKDNKFIYEVVKDELVSVEATYMDKYEIIKGEYILTEGYLVENVEDNQWVVLDKEIVSVSEPEDGEDFILNTETKVYHNKNCNYLPKDNRKDVKSTIEILEKNGYKACEHCFKSSIPSTDKVNPETGAGDFVGMASAMAVMAIVAGAGLMISKK